MAGHLLPGVYNVRGKQAAQRLIALAAVGLGDRLEPETSGVLTRFTFPNEETTSRPRVRWAWAAGVRSAGGNTQGSARRAETGQELAADALERAHACRVRSNRACRECLAWDDQR